MDTQENKAGNAVKISFKTNGLMQKTVTSIVAVFFIFSGIPMPTSFAGTNRLIRNDRGGYTPVVNYNPALTAQPTLTPIPLPSGAAIQNTDPLSPAFSSLQRDGNPTPANASSQAGDETIADVPPVPSGWTRASSNPNYAFQVTQTGQLTYDLKVKNLVTGQEQVLATRWDLGQSGNFSDVYDVTPDGLAVIYSSKATDHDFETYIQKLDGSGNRIILEGQLQTLALSGDVFTVTMQSGESQQYNYKTGELIPRIPLGWSVAPSNANYAVRVHCSAGCGTSNPTQVFEILNLTSGMTMVVRRGNYYDDRRNYILLESRLTDVSSDGHYLVYGTEGANPLFPLEQAPIYNLYSMDLTTGTIVTVLSAQPQSSEPQVVFNSGLIQVTQPGSSVKYYDPATGAEVPPPVPAGWTRAASNANFAFATENRVGADNNNYTVLKVQDLTTGTIQELYSLQSPPYSYTLEDVSPDGKLVYFGVKNNYSSPATGWLRVQRVNDAAQKTDITGIPSSVTFLTNGDVSVTLLTSFTNGTELGNVYAVDQNTLQSNLTNIKLVAQGTAVLDEGYLIVPELNTYSNTFTVTVYDASAGTDHLVRSSYGILYHASQAAGGSSGSGTYRTIDVYRTSGGQAVLTLGISAVGNQDVDYSQTFVINLGTGAQLTLSGAVTGVTYQGNVATYTISYSDGSTETKYVDLDTLQLTDPPVPEGWTRAASNVNFAFKTETSYVAHSIYNVTLKVRNLLTGAEQMVASGQTFPYAHPEGPYDISPDGATVVYGWQNDHYAGDSHMVVLKRLDGSTQLTLNGWLTSIRFENGNAILGTSGTIGASYTVKLQDLTVTATGYILNDPIAAGITYNADAKLVTQVVTINYTGYIRIYDATNGTDQMTLLLDRAVTTGYPTDQITFVDIHQTTAGRGIVSYSAETYAPSLDYDYTTVVMDSRTGEQLSFNGRATSATYDGAIARYEVVHRDGSTSVVFVDLETLQLSDPPVPEGWTRAASNANYAYRQAQGAVLEVIDLVTGSTSVVYDDSVDNKTYDFVDVSQDGHVVFSLSDGLSGTRGLYVAKLDGSDRIALPTGGYMSIHEVVFSTGHISIRVDSYNPNVYPNGGVYEIDTLTKTYTFTPNVPEGWTVMPGNPQLAFQDQVSDTPRVLDLLTNQQRPMTVGDITSMSETTMLNYFSNVTGFPTYGISLTPTVIDFGGRLRPVVQVAYVLEAPGEYSYQSKGTLFFDLNGDLENAHEMEAYRPLVTGELLAGQCAVADQSTSVSSTGCGGIVISSSGIREIHTYNDRGNTGVTIYDSHQQQILSYGIAFLSSTITQASISPDGKYFTAVGQLNSVSVLSLTVPASQQSVLIPQASGYGAPMIGQVEFISATRILVTMADGSNRQFYIDIQPDGQLVLTQAPPPVPEGWTRAVSNANYAFRVLTVGKGQSLLVKDLLTGKETTVIFVGAAWRIGSAYDIAPDGKTVAYTLQQTGSKKKVTVVQKLLNPSKRVVLEGGATSIKFVGDYWVLVINGRTVRVNPVTLRVTSK